MKKNILLLILLYCGFALTAQTIRFSKYYNLSNGPFNHGGAVEVLPQGYALLAYDDCVSNNFCTTLAITDTLGVLLQQKTFRGLILEDLRYHREDSTFLLWGRFIPAPNEFSVPCMLKVNYQGDTLWSFSLTQPKVNFGHRTLELPDKSILLTTGSEYDHNDEATIIKTDSVGHLLWVKGYDTGNYFKGYNVHGVLAWKDSTVLLAANGIDFDVPDSNFMYNSGVALFQIDYDGHLLYDTAYRIDIWTNTDAHTRLARIPGDRVVTSSKNYLFHLMQTGTNLLAINMADKSIDWSLGFYDSFGQAVIDQLYTTLDSGIVACGSTYTTLFPDLPPIAWLLKASAEGELEWQRLLPNSLSNQLADIKPTPDGGYIVTGSYEDPDYNGYVVLIKIDGHGCLQPDCDSLLITTSVGEQVPLEQLIALKIQPNPANALLMIDTEGFASGQLQVVDLLGCIVAKAPVSAGRTSIPVNRCANGVYAVQYIDAMGKIRAVGRVLVQH